MPPPKPPPEQPTPANAPRKASASKPSTPNNRKASANASATPKSAPAAAAAGAGAALAAKKKPAEPPSLLTDFLLGRPSPQRVRAQSQTRRKSVALDAAGVREELRQEMRAAAVRKLQQPGGVKDRVKHWQKANAAAMRTGLAMKPEVVEDAASEPPEILVQVDAESVTEEDRVRIKMRQKPGRRRSSKTPAAAADKEVAAEAEGDNAGKVGKKPDVEIHQEPPSASKPRPLPKKRIVSDEHWMKQRQGKKSPPRKASPKAKAESKPAPLPKDFLARTAQNPTIHDKIKDWTQRVEIPDSPPPTKVRKYKTKGGDSITIEEEGSVGSGSTSRPSRTSEPADDGIRVTPVEPRKPKQENDDGIRIKPTRVKEVKEPPDDGIRVKPAKQSLADDGIRKCPVTDAEVDDITVRSSSSRDRPQARGARLPSRRRGISPDDTADVTEQREADVETPTKKRGTVRRRPKRSVSPPTATQTQPEESTEAASLASKLDDESDLGTSQVMSDLPSIAPGSKSLADIPVGFSAFSELDLPLGADARNSIKRPKTQRNSSLKAVPNVLKSLVSEGKKIISHDKVVEPPPRTGINKPPSIENWLNTTVDPFVDEDLPKKTSVEKEWVKETRRRSSSEAAPEPANRPRSTERREDQEHADPTKTVDDDPTPKKSKTHSGSGLKRKGATRSTSSPLRPGQRKPFKEQLKEAFRGESGGHKLIPPVYPSYEARHVEDSEPSDSERYEPRRNSGGSAGRSPSPEPTSTVESDSSIGPLPKDSGFPRRKPPTNGFHELSTIVSEASHSTHESDTVSTVSQSTITQSTALTKSTDISRTASHKSNSGLKRRLTKHSDLVSVLSLPDNGHLQPPTRARSIRAGGRLVRKTSKILDNTPIEDLLEEFVDDEQYYQRELKTLVDGVVPVLLKQVVNGDGHSRDLFGSSTPLAERAMSKAVVEMGISLEKLRNFHRQVPMSDVQRLLAWLESVHPVYDRYLDVWRLGFQDLVVNLAPAAGKSAEEDSLVNALPRNEDGDALDQHGEPVDVAHLLKRPLIRIKWMAKLIRGAYKIQPTPELGELLSKYEQLQDKARRRHREETARKTDEDANNTDVTRTRDLRSLSAIDAVVIDQSRQVNAKDAFSLDLKHSNGQRLECRVEVIFRDNVNNPADKGDVLIRETGTGGQSWLLFPPIPKDKISARKGDSDGELTVMIRGYHNYRDWFELLTISCDDEDQTADWLGILGSDPMPPTLRAHLDSRARLASAASPRASEADIPVGERKVRKQAPASPGPKVETPSRYHKRNPSVPATPTTPTESDYTSPSPNKTPTQNSYFKTSRDDRLTLPSAERGSPLREGMRPDPAKLTKTPPSSATPYREDGAPPPPAHRTLKKSPPVLAPPVDNGISRVKRRGSSPLKHEYHPSDISSESSVTNSDESDLSDTDSSSDELDESDVPDVLPAISIKEKIPTPADTVISDSSLTPSASASQAGVAGGKESPTEWSVEAIAAISYWSNRYGIWKDVDQEACSIVITPGLVEAFPLSHANLPKHSRAGLSDAVLGDRDGGAPRPLIALDLTPLVMIRMSNAIDLEIRSPVRAYSILNKIEGAFFRFRSPSPKEGAVLYDAVHVSRMNNAKFKALEEEARFRSFGQQQHHSHTPDHSSSSSSKRRSWFGRKNSYRASARAPSESQGSHSSGVSASSFLKRLTGGGGAAANASVFDLDKSTLDKTSRPPSASPTIAAGGGNSGPGSLYTSSASSSGGGGSRSLGIFRAPSLSLAGESGKSGQLSAGDRIPVRLYSAAPNKKWEDYGNCVLQVLRPPPGVHQELRVYHGMEKRVKITCPAKKDRGEEDLIVLDVVLGSGCFSRLGTKGVVVKVWEDIRDHEGKVGFAPASGGVSGKMKTWCLQTKTNAEANWVVSLLTQEVELG